MIQNLCTECEKVVDGLPVIDNRCPRCDCENFKTFSKKYEEIKFSTMDMYYESCSTRKETLGSLADKNTKKFGRTYVEENAHIQKVQRQKRIEEIFAQQGKKIVKSSGKKPWYRDGKGLISESEAQKFLKEHDVKVETKEKVVKKKVKK